MSEEDTRRRGRGRPFVPGYDPRRQPRKPRPRGVTLLEALQRALERGDLQKMYRLLLRQQDSRQMMLVDRDATQEEIDQALENLRLLCPRYFEPREIDIAKLYDRDPAAALAAIPEWLARMKLGLVDADDARNWPALSP